LLLHNCYISSSFIILCTRHVFMISVINHSSQVSSITSWLSPLQIIKVLIRFVDAIAFYSLFANALKLNYRSNRHVYENLLPFDLEWLTETRWGSPIVDCCVRAVSDEATYGVKIDVRCVEHE
jgi:hypothetical protein